ncbi:MULTISPECIES: hypothetical protein [unclassified Caballeronia]|uniref:hypothetical protein n=1 Tax=unclassified Caballeronia TaxID=2646786 RepID=UPI001F1C7847|nr:MULTISPECIES: hypothetical protein [unclassified Caballeronia]MCE4543269.1 hypothetical protein [Caballeronia sp. PC1]MCE4567675.1 hypothetical protein [Caballeronia sp. CLC5]
MAGEIQPEDRSSDWYFIGEEMSPAVGHGLIVWPRINLRGTISSMYQQQHTNTEPAHVEFQENEIFSAFAEDASTAKVLPDSIAGVPDVELQPQMNLLPQASMTVVLSPVPVTKSFSLSAEGDVPKTVEGWDGGCGIG